MQVELLSAGLPETLMNFDEPNTGKGSPQSCLARQTAAVTPFEGQGHSSSSHFWTTKNGHIAFGLSSLYVNGQRAQDADLSQGHPDAQAEFIPGYWQT